MNLCTAAAATPATRLKVVEALAARGCADVALDVLRVRSASAGGRGGGAAAEPLGEARVALAIRLDCNLVTEAFKEVSLALPCYSPKEPWSPVVHSACCSLKNGDLLELFALAVLFILSLCL